MKTLRNIFLKTDGGSKIIYLNILFFILGHVVQVCSYLFLFPKNIFFDWLALPCDFKNFMVKPWTIFSYGFVHQDFIHLFLNLIVLNYVGRWFVNYFTERQLFTFYLGGTILGGIFYGLCFSYLPAFRNSFANLIGASSGIMAIFIGFATYVPHYKIEIRFLGAVKIWVLVGIYLFLDFIQIPMGNAGGHLAHLGGALYGYLAVLRLKNKLKFLNIKISWAKKQKPKKQKKIDKILNKIAQSGYEALSKEEKFFLFKNNNHS